ncbi:MAG0490 family ComEA-like DNA-binding protein [Mycoplasmopsis alligatoris]|uniref:ComEA protein n=1 Tax=Mycoplasmopsis alligatoris A21JP2 TaxID=747682 RepID=D4XVX5_9BACT|nr:hypothetical protein [Mycoplasmopsis alligatoris]EFF41505.1 hypothetical protein MALL_0830 [Mycoplasmopsis alligatoris A21JP2]
MKKYFKYFLFICFIATSAIIFYFSFFDYKIAKNDVIHEEKQIFTYITKGAFKHNGKHLSTRKLTYRELFFIQGLLPESNIDSYELDDFAPFKSEIFVPYKSANIAWSKIKEINDLATRGIENRYAKILIDFKNKTTLRRISWHDLSEVSGIGIKTIEKLKKFLILD